jgi:hypothetical protein
MKKSILLQFVIIGYLATSCGPVREKQGELVIPSDMIDSLAEAGPQVRFYFYDEKS